MKKMEKFKINLSLLEGADELEDYLDEEEDKKPPEDETPEQKAAREEEEKKKKAEEKKWFYPGKFKTPEDMAKNYVKTEQYMKKMELELKEIKSTIEKNPPAPAPEEEPKTLYDQAVKELKITNDDFLMDAIETNGRIQNWLMNKQKEQNDIQVNSTFNELKGEQIKDKLRKLYPNFKIDEFDMKIGKIARQRHNAVYINAHPIKVFGDIVEELGGKKVKQTTSGEPYMENPTAGAGGTKGKQSPEDIVRDRIKNANVGNADLFIKK